MFDNYKQLPIMRFKLLLFFSFSISICHGQNNNEGVLLDKETKEPIEFVNVYNGSDYTVSNADGRYAFTSLKDAVTFYRVGYDKLETTFSQLRDTTFLDKSVFVLNEVVVTNAKTLWEKVRDSIKSNYVIAPYKEKFFLRGLLKYNDTISRTQDLQGKLKRKTLLYNKDMELTKKDFEVELLNMRKIGQITDRNDVYFKYPSLFGLLSSFVRLNATGENFNLTEKYFDDKQKIRLEFQGKTTSKASHTSGYYIINDSNKAIEEFHLKIAPKNPPYKEKRWLRYRTTYYEVSVIFEKDPIREKYFIRSAKSQEIVEATDKDSSFKEKYDTSFILSSYDNFADFPFKKNTNTAKDIFKLKHPYSPNYWNSQNQLLLTEKMQEFIHEMGEENTDFKVKSNMN